MADDNTTPIAKPSLIDPIIRDRRGPRIISGAPDIVTLPKTIRPEDITLDSLKTLSNDSFPLWCISSGVTIDGNTVNFNEHRYLLPIYMDYDSQIQAWQKAAQLGATVYMLLRMIFWLKTHQGRSGALYFPTRDGADLLSSARLGPMIQSAPELVDLMQESNGKDRNSLRRIGKSLFYIFHLAGKASKDSTPLDYVSFDEVRLCSPADIDQALERISHSPYKKRVFMSTAGLPGMDIAQRFNAGTQHIWQTACGCSDGVDLARAFPDCVIADDPRRSKKPYLVCPKCRYEIKDVQNGRYVPRNPNASYNSYHVSQLNSKFISIEEIWNFYKQTTNMPEFYNSKLGLPYVDEENLPITDEVLSHAISDEFAWAKPKEPGLRTAMGVDQMGQFNYVILADYDPQGRFKRVRHLEIIESDNPEYKENGKKVSPFKRLYEIMDEYNVRVCVIDAMPNTNEAMDFARAFPGRVFIGWYQQGAKDVVQWGDKPTTKLSLRKAGPLLRYKYHAIMSRYVSLDFALNEFVQGDVKVPQPQALMQYVKSEETGMFANEYICESRFFKHLKGLVRDKHVMNEDTGEYKMQWIPIAGDPHFAHAWNYCNLALERLRRNPQLVFA